MYQNVCMSVENLSIWKGILVFRLFLLENNLKLLINGLNLTSYILAKAAEGTWKERLYPVWVKVSDSSKITKLLINGLNFTSYILAKAAEGTWKEGLHPVWVKVSDSSKVTQV